MHPRVKCTNPHRWLLGEKRTGGEAHESRHKHGGLRPSPRLTAGKRWKKREGGAQQIGPAATYRLCKPSRSFLTLLATYVLTEFRSLAFRSHVLPTHADNLGYRLPAEMNNIQTYRLRNCRTRPTVDHRLFAAIRIRMLREGRSR
jgi:hypothetical protein